MHRHRKSGRRRPFPRSVSRSPISLSSGVNEPRRCWGLLPNRPCLLLMFVNYCAVAAPRLQLGASFVVPSPPPSSSQPALRRGVAGFAGREAISSSCCSGSSGGDAEQRRLPQSLMIQSPTAGSCMEKGARGFACRLLAHKDLGSAAEFATTTSSPDSEVGRSLLH